MNQEQVPEEKFVRDAKRFVPKPILVERFETALAAKVHVHPNVLSSLKLFVVTPLLFLTLRQVEWIPSEPWVVAGLFLAFGLLDYLDGLVARASGRETTFGKVFDRLTDYPLLVVVSWFCIDYVSVGLIAAKLALDGILLLLFAMGKGSTENRLRTGLNYTTVISLLFLSQGWGPKFLTPEFLETLLLLNIVFSGAVALHNLGVIGKFLIADMLSAANLICGVMSMVYASRGRFELSLLMLMIGAAFDGLDGAAARRWGGTKWGVYSDDVADGVNNGIAPGVAVYFALSAPEGVIVGAFFTLFTLSRLVFFTLNKEGSDPNYFSGVPSTVGALLTLCGIILFRDHPALVGLCVGVACVQMVSFDSHFRHLGRLIARRKTQAVYGLPLLLVGMVLGVKTWGVHSVVAVIFGACLIYGFAPTAKSFRSLLGGRATGE